MRETIEEARGEITIFYDQNKYVTAVPENGMRRQIVSPPTRQKELLLTARKYRRDTIFHAFSELARATSFVILIVGIFASVHRLRPRLTFYCDLGRFQ